MSRYGIGEWYGRPFLDVGADERRSLANIALGDADPPPCPFRPMTCNKRGGVCAIRPYADDSGRAKAAGDPVIVCPTRLEQDQLVVRWLAEIVGISDTAALVAREVPFMRSAATGRSAGKIDLVVAAERHELRWFGLEIQAVYFSGDRMAAEFEAVREKPDVAPYPCGNRRPDWRSSSAKRLMPQLQVKGPTLRRWQSKLAVAVDAPFFDAIGGRSARPNRDLDSGDVIWLVARLDETHTLVRDHWEVLTLESSYEKLRSAEPITRSEFERTLREKLSPILPTWSTAACDG